MGRVDLAAKLRDLAEFIRPREDATRLYVNADDRRDLERAALMLDPSQPLEGMLLNEPAPPTSADEGEAG